MTPLGSRKDSRADSALFFLCVSHLGLSHKISFGEIIIPTKVHEPPFLDEPIEP